MLCYKNTLNAISINLYDLEHNHYTFICKACAYCRWAVLSKFNGEISIKVAPPTIKAFVGQHLVPGYRHVCTCMYICL